MSRNPYKDYYKAMNSGDEWAGVRAAEARERIKCLEEAASWNGTSVHIDDEYRFSGGD